MPFNRHVVSGMVNDRVLIQRPPVGPLSKDDALEFAAWIVVCAGCDIDAFNEVYDRITAGDGQPDSEG